MCPNLAPAAQPVCLAAPPVCCSFSCCTRKDVGVELHCFHCPITILAGYQTPDPWPTTSSKETGLVTSILSMACWANPRSFIAAPTNSPYHDYQEYLDGVDGQES